MSEKQNIGKSIVRRKIIIERNDFLKIFCNFQLSYQYPVVPQDKNSLKEIWNNFVRSVKFMQKVERDKDRAEKSHDLGFWCVNFFNTAAARTVERLRHIVELTRKYLATQQQTKTLEKRPKGVLNRQVGELLRSCSPDISASRSI